MPDQELMMLRFVASLIPAQPNVLRGQVVIWSQRNTSGKRLNPGILCNKNSHGS